MSEEKNKHDTMLGLKKLITGFGLVTGSLSGSFDYLSESEEDYEQSFSSSGNGNEGTEGSSRE